MVRGYGIDAIAGAMHSFSMPQVCFAVCSMDAQEAYFVRAHFAVRRHIGPPLEHGDQDTDGMDRPLGALHSVHNASRRGRERHACDGQNW